LFNQFEQVVMTHQREPFED